MYVRYTLETLAKELEDFGFVTYLTHFEEQTFLKAEYCYRNESYKIRLTEKNNKITMLRFNCNEKNKSSKLHKDILDVLNKFLSEGIKMNANLNHRLEINPKEKTITKYKVTVNGVEPAPISFEELQYIRKEFFNE